VWTGARQRGVQLHGLRDAVGIWANRYGQRAWLHQLNPVVTGEMEDAVLQTIARLDGTPFPSTAALARGGCPAGCRSPGARAAGPNWRRLTAQVLTPYAAEPADGDRDLSPAEARWVADTRLFWRFGGGYSLQQSTRPQALAYGLADSPVAQLAWILDWPIS
jgi:hypothetical protein